MSKRRKMKPQEQLDSLKAGLARALEHPDCVRNQHGDYLYPANAMRRIENVLIKHGVTTGAWLLNNNIEKKKGRKRSTALDTYAPATVEIEISPTLEEVKTPRRPDLLDALVSVMGKKGIEVGRAQVKKAVDEHNRKR